MATRSSRSDESRVISGPGVRMRLLATGEDTDGAWSLFEYEADAGFEGPAPHWHEETIEGFYVLEGTVDFEIDDQDRSAGPNEFVLVPPRTVHTFAVDPGEPARFLVQISPGGFEAYFRELQELIAEAEEWPPSDMAPVLDLMARHDSYAPPVE
jgi:mannose-6-phosphate isomerase-like protein (cupin superfamily)